MKVRKRIAAFIQTKWKRLALVGLFAISFNYVGNVIGMILGKSERTFKQAKSRWISRNEPDLMANQTAWDTQYKS